MVEISLVSICQIKTSNPANTCAHQSANFTSFFQERQEMQEHHLRQSGPGEALEFFPQAAWLRLQLVYGLVARLTIAAQYGGKIKNTQTA